MRLSRRLYALRKKFPGVSQTEMGKHFGLKLRMYQRYETGEAEPEAYKMRRIIQRIEQLEKLDRLPVFKEESKAKDSGIHEHSAPVRAGAEIYGIDYYIEENKTLRDEIRSLKKTVLTNETTITFLHEEISRLKTALETAARNN